MWCDALTISGILKSQTDVDLGETMCGEANEQRLKKLGLHSFVIPEYGVPGLKGWDRPTGFGCGADRKGYCL